MDEARLYKSELNFEKAIEYLNFGLESAINLTPQRKYQEKHKDKYLKKIYQELADCYYYLGNVEQTKLYADKYLQMLSENERIQKQDFIQEKYFSHTATPSNLLYKKKNIIKNMVWIFVGLYLLMNITSICAFLVKNNKLPFIQELISSLLVFG